MFVFGLVHFPDTTQSGRHCGFMQLVRQAVELSRPVFATRIVRTQFQIALRKVTSNDIDEFELRTPNELSWLSRR